jgi:SAM-dependent methyltransferase
VTVLDQATVTSRHLDLGCGRVPRNPYNRTELHGIDINPVHDGGRVHLKHANLALEPVPYEANFFDSVSAYDFLEHLPRVALDAARGISRFPFIELMNEVHRVLKPDGLLYASTPCFPHRSAFGDPTHVNFVTEETHEYFVRPLLLGRMYGFIGDFSTVRVARFSPTEAHVFLSPQRHLMDRVRRRIDDFLSRPGRESHILWELRAIKQGSSPKGP